MPTRRHSRIPCACSLCTLPEYTTAVPEQGTPPKPLHVLRDGHVPDGARKTVRRSANGVAGAYAAAAPHGRELVRVRVDTSGCRRGLRAEACQRYALAIRKLSKRLAAPRGHGLRCTGPTIRSGRESGLLNGA
eukprot:scaffold118242_cov75-Phaeocystis_antarctica.AAC.3